MHIQEALSSSNMSQVNACRPNFRKESYSGEVAGVSPCSALAGTDASEAFRAFKHPPSAYMEMKNHCIGVMESGKEGGQQASASAQQLILTRNSMEKAGLFKVDLWNYAILAAGLVVAFAAVLMCVAARWVVPGALLLALFWQQVRSSLHEQLSARTTSV